MTLSPPGQGVSELILHVGHCKTGSTTLQAALARDAAALSLGGLSAQLFGLLGRGGRRAAQGDAEIQIAKARPVLVAMRERIAAAGPGRRRAVISEERLEFVNPQILARLVAEEITGPLGLDLRVLAYIRPHAERLLASFTEQSKIGAFAGDLAAFRADHDRRGVLDYADWLARWRAAFGPGFTARPYLRDGDRGWDVLADFRAWLDPSADRPADLAAEPRTAVANAGLGLRDLIRMRHLQARLAPAFAELYRAPLQARHQFGWHLGKILQARPDPADGRLRLHRGLVRRLEERWAADAAALDRDWFPAAGGYYAARLAAAAADAPPDPAPLDPGAYFPASELRSLDLWAAALEVQMRHDPRGFLKGLHAPGQASAGP